MKVGVSVKRSGHMDRTLRAQLARLGRRVQAGLLHAGMILYDESQKLVPRDTETLALSGRVTQIESLLDTQIVVGYGGKDIPEREEYSPHEGRVVKRKPAEHAVYVHEDITKAHDPGQQADYLGQPLKVNLPEMRLALEIAMRSRS